MIRDSTLERLPRHAKPLLDTIDSVVNRALDALEQVTGDPVPGGGCGTEVERRIDPRMLPRLSDPLTTEEAAFAVVLIDELKTETWAQPLLRDISDAGGLVQANKARFFELRFGYALHQAGILPHCETEGAEFSTLDGRNPAKSGFSFTRGFCLREPGLAKRDTTRYNSKTASITYTLSPYNALK